MSAREQTSEISIASSPNPTAFPRNPDKLLEDNTFGRNQSTKQDNDNSAVQFDESTSTPPKVESKIEHQEATTLEPLQNTDENSRQPIENPILARVCNPSIETKIEFCSKKDIEGTARPVSSPTLSGNKRSFFEELHRSTNDDYENCRGRSEKDIPPACFDDIAQNSSPMKSVLSSEFSLTNNKGFVLASDGELESLMHRCDLSRSSKIADSQKDKSSELKHQTNNCYVKEAAQTNSDTNPDLSDGLRNPIQSDKEQYIDDLVSATDGPQQDLNTSDYAAQPRDELVRKPYPFSPSAQSNLILSPEPVDQESTNDNRKQRKEIYFVKKITWCDQISGIARVSPILVQNVNGPCPLLALVNALTLTTPAGIDTPLVETLRSREQVSLGLLLDAVFDELTSERRCNTSNELPDVTVLYSFLVTLHTGMNVNPCFFPNISDRVDSRSISQDTSPDGKETLAGTFEETHEMRLYSTFNIPLVHGWLPQRFTPEYYALFRSAKTYEDAQNKMLMQESLESKLAKEGLNSEDQILLEDILAINFFFESSATQLTPNGLQTITSSMPPGTVAILFRNNHFSTLYRNPETQQLLQLVTDMGYAKNREIVWESLTDVTGKESEFYSGDLKLLNCATSDPTSDLSSRGLDSRNFRSKYSPGSDFNMDIHSVSKKDRNMEQEDHDLALAYQLQDEEERKHQTTRYQRRHKSNLSQQQGIRANVSETGAAHTPSRSRAASTKSRASTRPTIPPRRSIMNISNQTNLGTVVTEISAESPPSYEVAASQQAYVPLNTDYENNTLSQSHNPNHNSSENEYLRNNGTSHGNDRQQRYGDQFTTPRAKVRRGRRLDSVHVVRDKMINGQERVQRECQIM